MSEARTALPVMPHTKARRPYEDHKPGGYLESDRDYFENNREACLWFLEHAQVIRRALRVAQPYVKQKDPVLLPCTCGGKVGLRSAVKIYPELDLITAVTRYKIKCARCKKIVTTKEGRGYRSMRSAIAAWNICKPDADV